VVSSLPLSLARYARNVSGFLLGVSNSMLVWMGRLDPSNASVPTLTWRSGFQTMSVSEVYGEFSKATFFENFYSD
jgi:hypothetical protein